MVSVAAETALRIRADLDAWVHLLTEAVDAGAGMGFMPPLPRAEATAFWRGVSEDVDAGTRIVLAARVGGELAGTAQLDLCQRTNGLHRAECQKVIVRRDFQRRGIARILMGAIEEAALARGRTTLYLDTFAEQEARHLYEACGWTPAGEIPAFARLASGQLGTARLYYKLLQP